MHALKLSTAPIMKKKTMPTTTPIPSPPLTPPTPQLISKIPKSLLKPTSTPITKWAPLNLSKSELSLPLTFPTGQTFRWKQTGPLQYTGAVGPHLVSLKHLTNGDVSYCLHRTSSPSSEAEALVALRDFLNVGICLSDVWEVFSASDSRFAELAGHLGGARVLRQDPLECLMQFLCSSNNNIQRITKMVNFISSLGNYLGTIEGFEFHEFPSLERLSTVAEQELREAGFGYRAKYITGTVKALQSKHGGGVEWLLSLRKVDLDEAIDALLTLPGVGPKVAACIALFSLDQHHAIPVDTHVWQIATRHLLPELAGARLTPKLCSRVAEAFVNKYGKYAGWAQTLLFIAELPSQKAILPSHFSNAKGKKSVKRKIVETNTTSENVINDIEEG
ncbi:N-glycosylase/DNA lyase OGG1 [Humulus lupulus]|uniref:N-glycosylase/DNA lyase OGG1 n=1 Tax=Humulus lupulus TaxID=3486 RepID=UPI002B402B5F|nr:N-glycosylase/DNA lyase OGG1 [Humulus lupulus]XP_062101509.1 N-glycosylase/DNA lyase OGG1 [Humulus lupulus]